MWWRTGACAVPGPLVEIGIFAVLVGRLLVVGGVGSRDAPKKRCVESRSPGSWPVAAPSLS